MEELEELKQRLSEVRPAPWEALPDLNLYMDQLIGYMPRQFIDYGEKDRLTAAMVNNYIKDGLLPRAEGKRYSRPHLAYLTAICAMKKVLPVRDAGLLAGAGQEDTAAMYERFRAALDEALQDTAERLDGDASPEELPQLALSLALHSYADQLACERIIELIRQERDEPEKGKKSKKEKEPKQ